MQKTMSFKDNATVSIKGNYCRIHLYYMSKDEATNLFENSDLTEKSGTLQNITFLYRNYNVW